jgi:hypothetical protein
MLWDRHLAHPDVTETAISLDLIHDPEAAHEI